MTYFGFPYRTELVKKNISLNKKKIILELGVGTGHSILSFSTKCKQAYGFDISKKTISYLRNKFKIKNLRFDAINFCSKKINKEYNNKFDVVFSTDTLEHVHNPKQFFLNLKKVLKEGGVALIGFPNESTQNHHGLTWFNTKKEFLNLVPEGFNILRFYEVKETKYFAFIKHFLWNPLMVLSSKKLYKQQKPQTFEKTYTQYLNENKPFLALIFSIYPKILMILSKQSNMFKYYELNEEIINNKYLLLKIEKNKQKET